MGGYGKAPPPGGFSRIESRLSVGEVPAFSDVIVGSEVRVADGPLRRPPIAMLAPRKVGQAPTQDGRTVELGITADMIASNRPERSPLAILPAFLRVIAVFLENRLGFPIGLLARKIISAFENQNGQSGGGEGSRKRSPSGAAADNDDVCVHPSAALTEIRVDEHAAVNGHGRSRHVAREIACQKRGHRGDLARRSESTHGDLLV